MRDGETSGRGRAGGEVRAGADSMSGMASGAADDVVGFSVASSPATPGDPPSRGKRRPTGYYKGDLYIRGFEAGGSCGWRSSYVAGPCCGRSYERKASPRSFPAQRNWRSPSRVRRAGVLLRVGPPRRRNRGRPGAFVIGIDFLLFFGREV